MIGSDAREANLPSISGCFGRVGSKILKCTSALWGIFKKPQVTSAMVAGAATAGAFPILSMQLGQIEDISGLPLHTEGTIYYLILLNAMIFGGYISYSHIVNVSHFHQGRIVEELSCKDGVISAVLSGSAVTLPFLTWNYIEEDVARIITYTGIITLLEIVPLSIISLNYCRAIFSHIDRQREAINIEVYDRSEGINWKMFGVKSIFNIAEAMVRLSMLVGIELSNQEVAGSDGFDIYMAWATAYGGAYIALRIIENNFFQLGDNNTLITLANSEISCCSKILVDAITLFSLIGRGAAYTAFENKFLQGLGVSEDVALPLSIIIGGIATNGLIGYINNGHMKALVSKIGNSPITCKAVIGTAFMMFEGCILTFPITSEAFVALSKLTEHELASQLLPMIALPVFLEEGVIAATRIHNVISGTSELGQGAQRLAGEAEWAPDAALVPIGDNFEVGE